MNKILTCTDGSIYSQSVYALTAWAAKQTGAAVHVIHMIDAQRERARISDWSGSIGIDSRETLLQELVTLEETQGRLARERGQLILDDAKKQLEEAGISQVATEQLHGELVEAVVELETDADMVVIGKRGQSADLARGHLGSNLERVVRASIRPVLVAARKFSPIKRVLIAFDGGASVQKAVDFIAKSTLLNGTHCILVLAGKITTDAESSLVRATALLRNTGLQASTQIIAGEPERVISETVQKESIDLLVMGAYGHSKIRHLIIGSTTTAMVRTCQIPILMFR